MKTRILTFIMLFIAASAFADVIPEFHFPTPVMGSDGSNATCVALVFIDGTMVESDNVIEVAFFDQNGTCRGRNFVQDWGSPYGYQFQSVFYGNTGQLLTFKFYNHNTEKSSDDLGYVCTTSLNYTPNLTFGTLTNPENIYFYIPTTCTFTNESDNNWSTAANWTPRIPVSCDAAVINGACVADDDATMTYTNLSIFDGGQFDPNGGSYIATFQKNIAAYTPDTRDNYYFIANPTEGEFLATTNLLTGNYDLYFFNQMGIDDIHSEEPATMEWQNYRTYIEEPDDWGDFEAEFGGYLYANESNTTLQFTGVVNSADVTSVGALTVDSDAERFSGFNLVGNPLPCNATVTPYQTITNITGFYTISENRDEVISIEDPIVAPCTALFAVTTKNSTANRKKIKFTPNMSATPNTRSTTNLINIEISDTEGLVDRAYVRFNEQENLQKFTMNEDATHIFFREDGKDYAIVQGNERMSQLPLYFETKEYGEYTLNVKMENMSCKYLHLIDNITGADIDLNATPSYTFRAKQGDYSARFRLVFEGTGVEEEGSTESFVIVEGNRFIIPEVQNGSTLTVIDMMGRVVSSQTISGSFDQVMNLANGMYIVRLNGKTQKIVVK